MRFRVLGSGSSGNTTLVEAGGTFLLIDAGLGPRETAERLQSLGIDPGSIAAIVLSHEHQDHSKGAPQTPNAERFNEKDLTNWAFKMFGTYQAPWRITLNPVLRYQAGGKSYLMLMVRRQGAWEVLEPALPA